MSGNNGDIAGFSGGNELPTVSIRPDAEQPIYYFSDTDESMQHGESNKRMAKSKRRQYVKQQRKPAANGRVGKRANATSSKSKNFGEKKVRVQQSSQRRNGPIDSDSEQSGSESEREFTKPKRNYARAKKGDTKSVGRK